MAYATPELTDNDRIGLTVFGSILLHMVVILGITFAVPKLYELHNLPTMEITLVQTRNTKTPENADYLAQANQDGGGLDEAAKVARNPLPIKEIGPNNNRLPAHQSVPQQQIKSKEEVSDILTQKRSNIRMGSVNPKPEKKDERSRPPVAGLIRTPDSQQERTRLSAEISRFWQEYQQKPRKKYINARTREYKYAAYMDAWRAKVERVGNLNYPEQARRQGLSGNLVLDVALNQDGTLNDIHIRRSSGHKLLDDAAIRIVSLAAPFAPFPRNIREEADILHITRTWKFNQEGWREGR